MHRYWDDDDATAAAQLPGGWLRTGDLGCLSQGEIVWGRLWVPCKHFLGGLALGLSLRRAAPPCPALLLRFPGFVCWAVSQQPFRPLLPPLQAACGCWAVQRT